MTTMRASSPVPLPPRRHVKAAGLGWTVVSMKDDWNRVYVECDNLE